MQHERIYKFEGDWYLVTERGTSLCLNSQEAAEELERLMGVVALKDTALCLVRDGLDRILRMQIRRDGITRAESDNDLGTWEDPIAVTAYQEINRIDTALADTT